LFAWHAAHRIRHSLHDVGVRTGPGVQWLCYGMALVLTIAAGASLMAVGS
jgi:fumarate reductase subunit D